MTPTISGPGALRRALGFCRSDSERELVLVGGTWARPAGRRLIARLLRGGLAVRVLATRVEVSL
jgi:hypothetical protein